MTEWVRCDFTLKHPSGVKPTIVPNHTIISWRKMFASSSEEAFGAWRILIDDDGLFMMSSPALKFVVCIRNDR